MKADAFYLYIALIVFIAGVMWMVYRTNPWDSLPWPVRYEEIPLLDRSMP